MEKKKRILPRLFAALVILTLVSCCFIGSTFARYTSSSTGSATVEVAKWSITAEGKGVGETTANFDKLSPAQGVYESTARTKSTAKVLVATISYTLDVKATLTLTTDATPTISGADGKVIGAAEDPSTTKYGTSGVTTDGVPTKKEVQDVFSIKLYTSTSEGATSATEYSQALTLNEAATEGATGTIYVYAQVTWTSDDETIFGANADIRDTWIGGNVTSVAWKLTYTAVQASELPV